jgi:hypothetical protein
MLHYMKSLNPSEQQESHMTPEPRTFQTQITNPTTCADLLRTELLISLYHLPKAILPRSGQGQLTGSCSRGNEPSGSIQCGEFLD